MTAHAGSEFSLAFAKQSAKGSAASAADFKLGITGGDYAAARNIGQLVETDSSRQSGSSAVLGAAAEGSPEFYMRPSSFPLWALGALGALADSGTTPNYTHTLTPGTQPYFTVWRNQGTGTSVDKLVDVRVASLTARGSGGGFITYSVTLMAAGDPVIGTTDAVATIETESVLVYPQTLITKGGVAAGTTQNWEITINNNSVAIPGDNRYMPYDIAPGRLAVDGSLTILWETDNDRRAFLTGTTGGTAITSTIFNEQLSIKVVANANTSVEFLMAAVEMSGLTVSVNPDGTPSVEQYNFRSQRQATLASYISVICKNQRASVP